MAGLPGRDLGRGRRAVASGGGASQQRGPFFVDTDLYKWPEAVGWELGRGIADSHAAALAALACEGIALIEAAQAPGGHLDTWYQLRAPSARFADLATAHELYCAGRLFQAAAAFWRGDAAVAQWEDMVARRMYLTGGVGSRHKDESFGDPFELPPDRAYCETCAAIGPVGITAGSHRRRPRAGHLPARRRARRPFAGKLRHGPGR